MVKKHLDWEDATLDDHSKRKLKILKEYFTKYLLVRCVLPQQEKFRLAIIDGFAGGGRYNCGSSGSPIIFIETLKTAITELNIQRSVDGKKIIKFECILILNDALPAAIKILKTNIAPLLVEKTSNLDLNVEILCGKFETVYPKIRDALIAKKISKYYI